MNIRFETHPNQPKISVTMTCSYQDWFWALLKTRVGDALGVTLKSDNELNVVIDDEGLTPFCSGVLQADGSRLYYKVSAAQAQQIADKAKEYLNTNGCDDEKTKFVKALMEFSSASNGFTIA